MRIGLSVLAGVLLMCGSAGQADAASYSVNQSIGAAGHVTGTITTDGTLGTITSANVTGWDLLVQGLGASTTLTNGNSGVYSIGDAISETATNISFDYSDANNSFLLFQAGGFGSGSTYWCNASALGACFQGASVVPQSYQDASVQVEPRAGVQVIAASAVPEPATWAFMIAGFGAIGGTLRKRGTRIRFA